MTHPLKTEIAFEGEQSSGIIFDDDDGKVAGNIIIKQSSINGNIAVSAKPVGVKEKGFKITIKITNTTSVDNPEGCSRDDVYDRSFLSANTILKAERGVFISQTAPDASWGKVSETLKNINTWPVLINRDDTTILSSPIVLYDYPEIAAESQGDMFDGTEIEEMLMLHMAALTEEEQQKIDQTDGKMKAMLERVKHTTPEELMNLHGRLEEIKPDGNEPKESKL
jgi:hydrogenase maturation protease